jgi:hypothetical protein
MQLLAYSKAWNLSFLSFFMAFVFVGPEFMVSINLKKDIKKIKKKLKERKKKVYPFLFFS